MRSGNEYRFVKRSDFEAWVQLNKANMYMQPDYSRSKIKVMGLLPNGVKYVFEAYGMALHADGRIFFGRGDEWNVVRVPLGTVGYSFFGPGARDGKTWDCGIEWLGLLL